MIYLASVSSAWSPRWNLATALAVASYFNVSSGALTPAAVAVVSSAQIVIAKRRGRGEWTGIVLQCAIALVMIVFIPRLSYHEPLKAHSLAQFASAFLTAACWPLPPAFVILLHAPMALLAASVARDRPGLRDVRWVYVCLWVWLVLQYLSLAYGRAVGVTSSRYVDVFLVGVVLNFAALLDLVSARRTYRAAILVSAWVLVVSAGSAREAILKTISDVLGRQQVNAIETQNVRGYITTGDFCFLNGKPFLHIPYPDPNRLRSMIDEPEIRLILPPVLVDGGIEPRWSSSEFATCS